MNDQLEKHHLKRDDLVPKLTEQAAHSGWKAGIFSFGLAEKDHVDYFNPGIVERPDGLWLLVRRSIFEDRLRFGRNAIYAFALGEPDGITPLRGVKVQMMPSKPEEQFEDPRAVVFGGRTWIGACNFVWFGDRNRWTGGHQILVPVDDKWVAVSRYDPDYGKNGGGLGQNRGHEKNWLWWFHSQKPHMLYAGPPNHEIVEFDGEMRQSQVYKTTSECPWPHGVIRGGTPPVRVGDEYWTFFHSSMEWKPPYRRYFMGAYAFKAEPPFNVTKVTAEPLLIGSQNDYWFPRKPLVVFPCGALLREGKWLITLGVNDLKCGWVEIPHDDLTILVSDL
jgi:predicted GH43/DUF377 family glycosyl hydrolase